MDQRTGSTLKKIFGWGIGIWLTLLVTNVVLGGVATEYVVEFWGSKLEQRKVDVPFVPCAAVGLIAGQFTVPAAVVTWMLSPFFEAPPTK